MSRDSIRNLEKNTDSTKLLHLTIKRQQDQLQEKDRAIEKYESQLHKLYEDFNYNVDLIYERDQDIEQLNTRLEELTKFLQEKDAEILKLQRGLSKFEQIERENLMLHKKLESLQQESGKVPLSRMEASVPRLDYKSLLKDNKHVSAKKFSHTNGYLQSLDKISTNLKEEEPQDPHPPHFPEYNFDLESRIKALEQENTGKEHRKYNSLSNSRILENPEENDIEITGAHEKVKKQEKEISKLIKSLQVYKKKSEATSKKKLKNYDEQITALNEDIDRLRTGEFRSNSRVSTPDESEKKYRPVVRARSSFEKRPA